MAAATAIIIILPLYCCYCYHGGYQAVAVALQLCHKKAFQLYPHPMDIHDQNGHKDMGPETPTPPVNRETHVKTLPSRNFVCGR